MNKIKRYHDFLYESDQFIDWDKLTKDEKTGILFGKQSKLDKEFSEIMVRNLVDSSHSEQWSAYNAIKIELKEYDDIYNLEIKYRITDGENPKKVILSVLNKIDNKSDELIRLENVIKEFNF